MTALLIINTIALVTLVIALIISTPIATTLISITCASLVITALDIVVQVVTDKRVNTLMIIELIKLIKE